MRIYDNYDNDSGLLTGFGFDNSYVSLNTVKIILESLDQVNSVRKRKLFSSWDNIHMWFNFEDVSCVVEEPYGDSSMYWISSEDRRKDIDLTKLKKAFENFKQPRIISYLDYLNQFKFFNQKKKN